MKRAAILVAAAGTAAVAVVAADRYAREWGVDPDDASADLPGDDIVADADRVMTHGITIEAAPADVWPWLVQMGYGRGGWYSYDAVDMRGRSHETIAPALQSLAVGDVLPTHPDGGFLVRYLEPERALVVSMDTALARQQADAARARRQGGSAAGGSAAGGSAAGEAAAGEAAAPEAATANLRAAGSFINGSGLTEFSASWAFVLRDLGDGRTRLVERFRVRVDAEPTPGTRIGLPFLGFGVFVMLRRQLLGIRERAEGTARERRFAAAETSAEAAAASSTVETEEAVEGGDGPPEAVPAPPTA